MSERAITEGMTKGEKRVFYSAGWFFVLALLAVGFVMGRMW